MTAQRHAVDTNATDVIVQHAPIAPVASDRLSAIRETVDLLEIDLGTMIRAVEQAAEKVRLGARASAESLLIASCRHHTAGTILARPGRASITKRRIFGERGARPRDHPPRPALFFVRSTSL